MEGEAAPFLNRATLGTLDRKTMSPRLEIAVGPLITRDFDGAGVFDRSRHHSNVDDISMHAQVSGFTDRTLQRLLKAETMDGVQFRESCQRFSHCSWLQMGHIESNGMRHTKTKGDETKSQRKEQTNTRLTC